MNKYGYSILVVCALVCRVSAGEGLAAVDAPMPGPAIGVPAFSSSGMSEPLLSEAPASPAGTRGLSNFIGFMSNPLQNIDPRSLTQVWPIFLGAWTSEFGPLPPADFQIYGAGMNLALTERLSVGLNQGGFAAIHTGTPNPRRRIGQVVANRLDLGNDSRTGFLNLGGFAQYTLIADEANQFLFTVGTRLEVPSGSYEVFQGKGPAYLSPYLTVGKGFGNLHLLATAGYEFPLRSGGDNPRTLYCNGHLDYQVCDWIYPLVEVNWSRGESNREVNLPLDRGFISLGNFDTGTEVVSLAVGINFVLVRDRLEVGGCWSTPLYTRRDFDFDSMLVKMVMRF